MTYEEAERELVICARDTISSLVIILTTSDFPPNILRDPFIAPLLPTRLQLVNGVELREWLKDMLKRGPRGSLH
jgi:restriction system protein